MFLNGRFVDASGPHRLQARNDFWKTCVNGYVSEISWREVQNWHFLVTK